MTYIHGIVDTHAGKLFLTAQLRGEKDGRHFIKVLGVGNPEFSFLIGQEHNFVFLSYDVYTL